MTVVRLASEIDFDGWRAAARSLRVARTPPEAVIWTVDGEAGLLGGMAEPVAPASAAKAPRAFVEAASRATLHRSDDRFALLYRLYWRLDREPGLMRLASDPEVARLNDLVRNVDRAAHKMKAFVRFRGAEDEVGEAFVAWFEPAHRVTEATAPFFVRRFATMRFSILTPDVCAHWDTKALTFTPGTDPADAPRSDALEAHWKTYYAAIFNPARLKTAAMTREMPKRYWKNLPEAELIPALTARAGGREAAMVAAPTVEPSRRILKAAVRASRDAPWDGAAPSSLDEVAAGARHCRRCDLWRDATQAVGGEGPADARLMLVGEQPGDLEDLAGRPFVGPAGEVLDRALAEAGVPRARLRIVNAVRHFKHAPQGKRRIHKTPAQGEVVACRWWLDAERRLVRPRVVLALGATAALAVTGQALAVAGSRGRLFPLADGAKGVVTWHPAYLLRAPDPTERARAYAGFADDLRRAWMLATA